MSPPTPAQPVIAAEHATVVLGERPVLRDVSLAVTGGEVVALLGSNGSGKSTLVRTLLGLVPLAEGDVRLFGTPLTAFSDWRRIGYVPQRAGASTGVPATVREVVTSGRLARRGFLRFASAADRAAVTEALETVGLAERARERVSTLSGGQQQRVLIARALAGEPDLLVLDEPNAGVDAASQRAFADTVARLVERGTTLLVVLHEVGPLADLITRTVVLDHGRVAHDGVPWADGHLGGYWIDTDRHHVHGNPTTSPAGEWDGTPDHAGPAKSRR
ncbi:metal ABC transporter ATP-binding protein [Cryptosporangium aurantiacum]|uniref:metal ABC transporter ATP-binding protein n=1 Tax=Cryptosporangium aurantiacum TaxID=134849 RepID=UPI00093310F9|nr:ABC transporter ATP-binding protein [Cryptosporangium aurantiacum]